MGSKNKKIEFSLEPAQETNYEKICSIEFYIHTENRLSDKKDNDYYTNRQAFKKLKSYMNENPDVTDMLLNIIKDYSYISYHTDKLIPYYYKSKLYFYKKELFKNALNSLNKFYILYYEEFFNIKSKNFEDLGQEEKKFLINLGKIRITNETAFYVLLYRHKSDNDFYKKFDLYNTDDIKDEYELFYDSYKKSDFFKNRKKV